MKKMKFLPFLVAMVLGLSFGFTSCGDDDDETEGTDGTEETEETTSNYNETALASGEKFWGIVESYSEATTSEKALNAAEVVLIASEYNKNKDDATYSTSFWIGAAAEKYDCKDNLEKAATYQNEFAEIKASFDDGVNAENVSDLLLKIANGISKTE